jgi:hypothetical protein
VARVETPAMVIDVNVLTVSMARDVKVTMVTTVAMVTMVIMIATVTIVNMATKMCVVAK